ncbi:MAG TPA: uroporphyrinogen-III C-methyltransferase [Phycisphaerae bacterium]|nr:uroporphyrinogen-III C-methyltransferase [Phycisphaerae bacterium]
MSQGRVYLVGAGPGDPGLMTLRGREVLATADVVVYDALISERLLDYAPAAAERIYVGKRASRHTLPQDGINALLVEKARAGATVVRLKGGDPFVFGRGGEEALALAEAGIDFEVVPGVTAAVAAAAYAGIPVTHREMASAVGFVTGHEAEDKADSALDWDALARWPGTLVFYMGVRNLPAISENLIAHGRSPDTPAAAVRWGTTPRHQTLTGTLATLPQAVEEAGLKAPAVILVGEVVTLRDRLQWFERRPLLGRRIVVTRARAQASALAERLESLGAETIQAPAIRIEPPDDPEPLAQAAREAASYDWIVFTSVNGVEAFFGALADAGLDARALATARLATIGPATTERLTRFGLQSDLQPETFTGAAVAEALAATGDLTGEHVLLPRADIAPKDLPDALAAQGAEVSDIIAYRTVPDTAGCDAVAQALEANEIDWLTFTSSSTVRNVVAAVGADRARASRARIASIGPTTSATLREAGLEPTVEADPHTIPGLVVAILTRETA